MAPSPKIKMQVPAELVDTYRVAYLSKGKLQEIPGLKVVRAYTPDEAYRALAQAVVDSFDGPTEQVQAINEAGPLAMFQVRRCTVEDRTFRLWEKPLAHITRETILARLMRDAATLPPSEEDTGAELDEMVASEGIIEEVEDHQAAPRQGITVGEPAIRVEASVPKTMPASPTIRTVRGDNAIVGDAGVVVARRGGSKVATEGQSSESIPMNRKIKNKQDILMPEVGANPAQVPNFTPVAGTAEVPKTGGRTLQKQDPGALSKANSGRRGSPKAPVKA